MLASKFWDVYLQLHLAVRRMIMKRGSFKQEAVPFLLQLIVTWFAFVFVEGVPIAAHDHSFRRNFDGAGPDTEIASRIRHKCEPPYLRRGLARPQHGECLSQHENFARRDLQSSEFIPSQLEKSPRTQFKSKLSAALAHQELLMSFKHNFANVQGKSSRASLRTLQKNGSGTWSRQEAAALLAVKAAIREDPLGALTSWQTNASTPCGWAGVLCSWLESRQHVIALDLSGRQLVGDIGLVLVALGRLDFLQQLDLSANGFHGSLSGPALANISSLQYLNLTDNEVGGSIPSEVGELRDLQTLSLSKNNLTGEIPPSLGNCSELTALMLGSNLLTGAIPGVFGNTPKLQYFHLGAEIPQVLIGSFTPTGNSLSGSLPSSLGNCSSLVYFDVNGNVDLGGNVPQEFSQLTELQFIYMTYCSFTGFLDDWVGNMSSLRVLQMRINFLGGSVPNSLGKLSNLEEIGLSRNLFSGTMPLYMSNYTNLAYLSLSYNNLTGGIGGLSFGKSSKTLTALFLGANKFTGVIPATLSNCSTLELLSLGYNPFDPQAIPEWIGSLPSLEMIELDNVQLIGGIPKEVGKLRKLQILSVNLNNLGGAIPSVLANSTFLQVIDVGWNRLTGVIPSELGELTALGDFYVNSNNLTGSIPVSLQNLTQLSYVQFDENHLSGGIDGIDWGRMSQLQNFSAVNNHLVGSVPSSLSNCSELWYLGVSGNKLTGHIPASFGNFSRDTQLVLDLSSNQLSGEVPGFLFKSSQLLQLWLDDNYFEGTIPSEIGGSAYLEVLVLSHNELRGELPESLGNCSELWELYLDNNQFSGSLSSHLFTKIVHLRQLDVSSNLLSGLWPQQLGRLQEIQTINLSANNFSGSIVVSRSEEFPPWEVLESLDLSINNFDGPIPESLGFLSMLAFLNVSFNDFQGGIPDAGIFQHNVTKSSFLGNPGLCGTMLGPGRECPAQAPTPASRREMCKGFDCRRVWIPTALVGLGLVFAVIFSINIVTLCWLMLGRSHKRTQILTHGVAPVMGISEREIQSMLRTENIIGHGAYSIVYKGGRSGENTFAIKTISPKTTGHNSERSHINKEGDLEGDLLPEVQTMAQIRHRNVVKVLSFCFGAEVKAIILEYMAEGSLHKHLHASGMGSCKLSFQTRLKIALDTAEGLQYLHHDLPCPLIHGDLKPTNILLDSDFTAKVADFGLSKFVHKQGNRGRGVQDASASTICGTPGYIPPEYAFEACISTRGDVYSFGVVLLELLTGRPPTKQFVTRSLLALHSHKGSQPPPAGDRVPIVSPIVLETHEPASGGDGYRGRILKLYEEGSLEMLDALLLEESSSDSTKREQMMLMLLVALLCTTEFPQKRPSMSDCSAILAQINQMRTNIVTTRRTINELVFEATA